MKFLHKFKNISIGTIFSSLSLLPYRVLADVQGTGQVTLQNPLKVTSIYDLFLGPNGVVNVVLKFAYIVVAFMIIWGGFKLIKAQGKPKELEDAKRSLIWTLVGAAIVIGANVIASVLNSTLQTFTN